MMILVLCHNRPVLLVLTIQDSLVISLAVWHE